MESIAFEIPVSVSAEAIWNGVVLRADEHSPFPEVVPEVYASVEGPWLQLGSVLRVKFNNGLKDCKWTITKFDSGARKVDWAWVDEAGPMAMRNHAMSLVVMETGANSSSVNISIQFDGKVSTEYANAIKESLTQTNVLFGSRFKSTCQSN